MARFTSRVGLVSLRNRAIAASLQAKSMVAGVKTADVARHQAITARRALIVMKYAEKEGWVYSVKSVHRNNAFYYRWLVSGRCDRALFDATAVGDKETAKALVSAYFWGKSA